MEEKIKISIIIPVYNVEKYLAECLESLLSQTFQNFEIICIDDSSTDNSYKILKKYQLRDNRIKIFQQNHKGAAEARNFGITLAQGKYIQFLDSDDYFEENMLEELYNTAEKYNADTVVCSSKKVDEKGNITETGNPNFPIYIDIAPLETPFSWKDYKENIFSLFHVPPWNKLYLKQMIIDNDIKFQNLSSCNDVYFGYITKIFSKKIVIINKELINYRYKREGSISINRGDKIVNMINAGVEIKNFLIKNKLFEELKESFYNAITNQFAGEIVHSTKENYDRFFNYLNKSMPEDYVFFKSKLRKDYITPEYIKDFIGNKKIFLWGASLFIKSILEREAFTNHNILGIIDNNKSLWGTKCGNYMIYSPDILNNTEANDVLLTVFSNNEELHYNLKKELKEKYNKNLLPNIFQE